MMRAPRPRWSFFAVLAVALVVGIGFVRSQRAAAHAILERSLPVQNQQLAEAPELVETWYSEPLERSLTTLEVLDTQGNAVHAGATQFSDDDPDYAAIAVSPDLGPGIYTVTYENVSSVDSHTWSGFFTFIILNPDGTVPRGEALIPSGLAGQVGFLPDNEDSAARWMGLLAVVLLGGGLFFVALVARPAAQFLEDDRIRAVEDSAMAVAAATGVAGVVVMASSTLSQLLLLARRLGGLSEADDILFGTHGGELWLARAGICLVLIALLVPALGSKDFRNGMRATIVSALALLGSLGLIMTYALGSHSASGGGAFWGVGADFVHFAATAAWLGALAQLPFLWWWTRRRLEEPERLLYLANVFDRFSWLAAVSVVLLLGTGIFNGFVQLPTLEALWDTTYGQVLLAKLSLILPTLGVAGINALLLKPALVGAVDALAEEEPENRGSDDRTASLRARLQRLQQALPRTIVAELLLGAAVIAAAGVLSQSATAESSLRAAAAQSAKDYVAVEETEDLDVELSISPFGLSVSEFQVRLEPKPGTDLGEVLGVRLLAFFDDPSLPPSAGISGTRQDLSPTDDVSVYTAEAALMTQPGDWRLQARVRRRGMNDAIANFSATGLGGFLARRDQPEGLFDLPFTFVDWNIVAGGALLALGLGAFFIWNSRPPSWGRSVTTSVGLSSAASLMAGAVFLFGVHSHNTVVSSTSPVLPTADSLAIGLNVYETNCVTCHGQEGRGDGPGAATLPYPPADLNQHVPYHNDGTLFLWISEGLPIDTTEKYMPSWKTLLTVDERWHVINYLREAFGSGAFVPVLPEDLITPTPEG